MQRTIASCARDVQHMCFPFLYEFREIKEEDMKACFPPLDAFWEAPSGAPKPTPASPHPTSGSDSVIRLGHPRRRMAGAGPRAGEAAQSERDKTFSHERLLGSGADLLIWLQRALLARCREAPSIHGNAAAFFHQRDKHESVSLLPLPAPRRTALAEPLKMSGS